MYKSIREGIVPLVFALENTFVKVQDTNREAGRDTQILGGGHHKTNRTRTGKTEPNTTKTKYQKKNCFSMCPYASHANLILSGGSISQRRVLAARARAVFRIVHYVDLLMHARKDSRYVKQEGRTREEKGSRRNTQTLLPCRSSDGTSGILRAMRDGGS